MRREGLRCVYDDCLVLAAALQNWTGRHWSANRTHNKARRRIGQIIDLVETIVPRDSLFNSRLDNARSLAILERLPD